MKRVLFLCSHPGADAEQLVTLLEQDQYVQFYNNTLIYKHPTDVATLAMQPHKNDTTAAIYATLLLDNHSLSDKILYKFCHFVYFIRRPQPAITELLKNFNLQNAIDLYVLRIRRLYEMAFQTSEAVFLTWENLQDHKGLDLVENYLRLKSTLQYPNLATDANMVLSSQIKEAEEAYEGIIYRMRTLKQLKLVH